MRYNTSIQFVNETRRTPILFFLIGMMLLFLASKASAIYTIQEFGTDGFRYASGTNITVSGKLLNDNTGEPGANITLRLFDSSDVQLDLYNTTTDSTGYFSEIITTASLSSGRYTIIPSAQDSGATAPGVNVRIYGEDDINSILISFTRGTVYAVSLDANGNGTRDINGTSYNFSVSPSNTISVDNGVNTIDNLITNSRVKLGNNTYSIFFVNRTSEIILARIVQPVFTGSEGSRNLTVLALNAIDLPLSGKILILNISDSSGVIATHTLITESDGLDDANISISATSGIYTIQIMGNGETLGTMSFSVNVYDVSGDVLSAEWTSQRTFARGQNVTLSANVKTTDGAIINDTQANVTAYVRGPSGFSQQFNLAYNTNKSIFYYIYTIPDNASQGTYTVEYNTTIGSEVLKSFASFDIRGYTLFLKPIGGKRDEMEGFFPGDQAYILVTGTDLESGDTASIDQLTGGSNRSNFTFSIRNSEGKDVTGTWNIMGLDEFFSTADVEPWLRDEIRARTPNASVISFTASSTEGIYDAKITVDLDGSTEEVSTSFGVQSIFLNAFPVSSDGNFAMSVSSQENVTLRIMAFNPKTMSPENDITAAGIVEAFAVDAGAIVTDSMLNPVLISLPDGSKALKFYNNDSNLGFHMVKFWANVTLSDGRITQAIGTGFFDVRSYYIWAMPQMEGNNFKPFTATSNVSLRVEVRNTGFTPQEGKTVQLDEVRYGQSWEKIDFSTTSGNLTGTTDSNGIANLSFVPTNPLKSGWYDVRISLSEQDSSGNTVTSYGRGWFEVRNFMFRAFSNNWNAKAGENIGFRLQAVNATDMGSILNATVRVKKVMVRTDWSQPPIEITGSHTLNGNATVDISTNNSREVMVNYTGGLTTKAGMYEFVFEATSGTMIEETSAWVEVRPFVTWVTLPNGQWNNRFGVNNTIHLIVQASDSWGGSNYIQLNASRTNITSVTKMGMFGGSKYKTQSELNITSVTVDTMYDKPVVNITLTLTGWQEGSYDVVINAVDNNGSEVITHFWIEVEIATVGLPEFYRVWIPENRVFTNKASFNLTDTTSEKVDSSDYPGLDDSVSSNFSNSKVGLIGGMNGKPFLMQDWNEQTQQHTFWALVNLTSPRKLYVNFNDSNFLDTNITYTQNMTEGDTFNEKDGNYNIIRRWNVTEIGSDGTIRLEGIDTLNNGYKIDPSISKSGNFIIESNFQDSQWLKVDLDGNEQYGWEFNSRNNTYYLLLADNATAGAYDTVIVSNTTNFTKNGINAQSAVSSDPVTFGGPPIYFVSLKKENSGYSVAFTSYTAGFGGMWLGTFERGKTLRIPFMVQEPGTTTGIPNVNVTVDRLTWYQPNFPDVWLQDASATTDSYGFAIITLNTTNIPTGQYLISYTVTLPGNQTKSATEKWRMPGMEIRKFQVTAQTGSIGSISTRKISNGNGLNVVYGTEIEPKGVVSAYQILSPYGASNIYMVGWPFNMENEYYYNATDGGYYPGFEWIDGNFTTTGDRIENTNIILTRNNANTTYNFTQFIMDGPGSNVTLIQGQPQTVYGYWNMTLHSVINGNQARLRIDYLYDDMTPPPNPGPWDPSYTVGSRIYWGPGELNIEITDINSSAVTFELFQPKIMYQVENMGALIDGNYDNGEWESGRISKISNYSGSGYDVYGYNDVNQTEIEKVQQSQVGGWGWSPTLDRVLVANGTWNNTYRIGEPIPELNNEYVGLVARWGGKMIFVNSTYTRIFPFQDWAADGDIYYVGNFTEADINADLNNNQNSTDDSTYYVRLEDSYPNGVFNVTSGMYDDDPDFTQGSNASGYMWTPIDLYGSEQGGTEDMWSGKKFDEKWINLGSMDGWPFAVPAITYSGNYANLTTFKQRWESYGMDEDVTVYVNAKTFSNVPVTGNISLDKLVIMFKFNNSGGEPIGSGGGGGSGIKEFEDGPKDGGGKGPGGFGGPEFVEVPGTTVPITNGVGVWRINYSMMQPVTGSFDNGNFAAKLNITDNEGNFETVEVTFFMMNRTAFMAPPGGGGSSPPGGDNPPPGGEYSQPPGGDNPPPGGNGTQPPGGNGSYGGLNEFIAIINGSHEVPSVDTPATGIGNFAVNFNTQILSYNITWSGITGENVTGVKIHNATAGSNGSVVYTLPGVISPLKGNWSLGEVNLTRLTNQTLYVNIYTSNHSAGLIRGQIVPKDTPGGGS